MATQPNNIKGQLADAAAALLTAEANERIQINKIDVFNDSGSSVADIAFHIVPSAGSAGAANSVYKIGSLADDEARNIPLSGHTLYNGDTLQAVAGTASAVNFVISFTRISS